MSFGASISNDPAVANVWCPPLAAGQPPDEPPPPGGWDAFLAGLRFEPISNSTACKLVSGDGREFFAASVVGQGALGTVTEYRSPAGAPASLAVKHFKLIPLGNSEVREVENVERMTFIDSWRARKRVVAKLGAPQVPDRIPARVVYLPNGEPRVVMPRARGAVPYSKPLPVASALNVTRAVFKEVKSMYETYGLLCGDLKSANLLVTCDQHHPHVRPADYGGYANVNSEVAASYPAPWRLSRLYDGSTLSIMTEEECVYQFFPFFVGLVYPTTMYPAQPDTNLLSYAYVVDERDGKHQRVKETHEAIFKLAWPADVRSFLEYCTRYRLQGRDYDMTLDRRTLAGLHDVLVDAVHID